MNRNTRLRITRSTWIQVTNHLLRNDGLEHCCFLHVGVHGGSRGCELLAGNAALIGDAQLVNGASPYCLEVGPSAIVDTVNTAVRAGVGLIEIHNHPEEHGYTSFSASDWSGLSNTVPYMLASLKVPVYGALVLGGLSECDGVVWIGQDSKPQLIEEIELVGPKRHSLATASSTISLTRRASIDSSARARFDRQIRAFGVDGQTSLSTLRIGIVGVGGIGSIVAELLARLGVKEFVLVDHDIAEISNLNRLMGMTQQDALEFRRKVEIARRQILAANPAAKVELIPKRVYCRDAVEALAEVDLIVGGTDDSASRFAINEIAIAYLRPYVDIATGINSPPSQLQVGGRYTFVTPGEGCLLCARAIDPRVATAEFVPTEAKLAQRKAGYIEDTDSPSPSVMPLNAIAASNAVFEIMAWATGLREPIRQRYFDAICGTDVRVDFDRDSNCLACKWNLGRGDLVNLSQKYKYWAGDDN